ncbi:MAG: OmpA family protein [Hyphomicrobiales bacterium]|nr:OmpA family protein [Hyphomicrobiales bacterium]
MLRFLSILAFGLLLIMGYHVIRTKAPLIERDLTSRVSAILASEGMDWAQVTLDGRDLVLSGQAPSEEARTQAEALVRNIWGVRNLSNQIAFGETVPQDTVEAPKVVDIQAYDFNATLQDGALTLYGPVPGEQAYNTILLAAENHFGRGNVENKMKVVAIEAAPKGVETLLVNAVIPQLAAFRTGSAEIRGNKLTMNGILKYEASLMGVEESVSRWAKDGFISHFDIETEKYTAAEQVAPAAVEDVTKVITEDAPSEDVAVVQEVPAEDTDENGITQVIEDVATAIVGDEDEKNTETVEVSSEEVAETEPASVSETAAEAMHSLSPASAPAVAPKRDSIHCRIAFERLLTGRPVYFKPSSARIQVGSKDFLDVIVEVAKDCPYTKLELIGFTDTRGEADSNTELSKQRAEAVRNYLIGHGVQAERLTAAGYGAKTPRGDNHTAEGRIQNRRVEFRIIGASS